jgi:2-amino-4-hydroxy-6-hydroxymethyldihydropteridine diphosphokinase
MARAFIGLGSNLGDRGRFLERARSLLAEAVDISLLALSAVDETEPVDVTDQPMFLNQVVLVETDLAPRDLLAVLQRIEDDMGRVRATPRGPRTIDLDLLLYGALVYRDGALTVPHPGIVKRHFVMKHLLELDGELADPVTGKKYREVYRNAENREHQ